MKLFYTILLSAVLLISCEKNKKEYESLVNNSPVHQVKITEVIQGGSYTFLQVNEGDQNYWMAVGATDAKVDDIIYYENPLVMNNFKSKELDREFDKILFVQNISDQPIIAKTGAAMHASHGAMEKNQVSKDTIKVDPAPGGLTIGELFKNGKDYANKKVLIRGKVVKINKSIMDRNWVHLKDGTSHDGKSDLTFTTLEEVNVNEVVTFEGTVSIDREYGAGYVYPLIVEGAVLKK